VIIFFNALPGRAEAPEHFVFQYEIVMIRGDSCSHHGEPSVPEAGPGCPAAALSARMSA